MSISSPIFNMFGRSPIKPLQQHMETAYQAAKALAEFFTSSQAGDWQQAQAKHEGIVGLEREADQLKKELRLHLPKNLFLPVPRGDLLAMITLQDRIANKAKDIAGLIFGRQMIIPEALHTNYAALLELSLKACRQAKKAICEMDELLETGFRGNEVKLVEEMIHKLDAIEHETDAIQIELRQKLFSLEDELPPINVMFLYKVIEWTGDLADRAQSVGGQLEVLLAR